MYSQSARRYRALLAFAGLAVLPASAAMAQAPAGAAATVVLDAAHGGSETGTLLSSQLLEKNLVLDLSIRLRSALTARGMHVVTTREADTNPSADARAGEANHARPTACVVLHATASGSGVHIYTSSLEQAAPVTQGLVPWSTAGAPFATDSLKLASDISAALGAAALPFTLGRVRLAPLDALRCPAVAVEVAPLRATTHGNRPAAIDDAAYQGRIVDALAAALLQWTGEHPSVAAQ
ncbi:N-acetylmuramoyl-L-alanine amidase [Acidipila sp. EB88]|uniref:N-acetylmuramoyl-L-alanine amidase family protein n=1 Tax=Acidipila sp. EB88 TaxID=2305226 RepID=UPI000F5EA486|nr:N-acetylmuramoyl-L-alanine amidase [Acidipila sp. EB88]RRA48887.1 N-acetylmuramoyl-L-alanine amidase [Acidipila sp. EB88]